ncbi:MAG: hypothetical protein RQ745_08695 [Longimicrobiales bacterium]|nr:hypothetical protein [Longimicrobiales bacterium]
MRRRSVPRAALRQAGVSVALALACALPLSAQAVVTARQEATAIREAAGLEWRGDLDGAERVLMTLLEAKPTSIGGLFALERVLRARDRSGLVLPWADAYLAHDPSASGIRALKMRVLTEIDSTSALRAEAEAWIAAEPGSEDPWREIARIWEEAFGTEAAEAILDEAGERLDAPEALANERGILRAASGDRLGAIEAWSTAVRRPGADLERMRRRIVGLGGDPELWAPRLFTALMAEPSSTELQRMAVHTALELGLHDDAARLAVEAVRSLEGRRRAAFLSDLVQEADAAGAAEVVLWGLVTLRTDAGSSDAPGLDVRIASAALATGDTTRAVEAQTRLARSLPPGSDERRRVIADLIRVEADRASPATLVQRFEGFRREFPTAPELDELGARVAVGVAAAGESATALALLGDPAPGPRSTLERGYIRMHDGEIESGVVDLEAALPGLAPERATPVIQLLAGMQRTTPPGARALSAAEARARWGLFEAALDTVAAALETVPPEDRPVLLSAAARHAAEAGDLDAAAGYLDAVIEGFPDAPERPEAMLRLAEIRGADPERRAEAVRLLEALIVEGPARSIVPAARRLLARLGGER